MPQLFAIQNITIGADPELFVARNGDIVSGHELPLGTKEKPLATINGHVQVDGMAVEVNVRPSMTQIGFIKNCSMVLQDLERLIKAADPEMYLVCRPAARFTEKYLETIPESAKELGCNPDWNAYEMNLNERPDANTCLRTAGGHIHIGWGTDFNCDSLEHIGLCAEVAKQLDYLIGVPSLEWDRDNERRSLYGKAGSFRPKKYGMEYRVLSPVWLLSITTTQAIFKGTMKALKMLNDGRALDEEYEGLAQHIINGNKTEWRKDYPAFAQELS